MITINALRLRLSNKRAISLSLLSAFSFIINIVTLLLDIYEAIIKINIRIIISISIILIIILLKN